MANAPAHGPWTWGDFVKLDEGDGRELIDGELVEVEVPTKLHEYIVWLLGHYLATWAIPRRAGFGVVSGFKVRINERRGVMPDLQFFRTGNPAGASDPKAPALERGRPDLAVEVISPTSGRIDRMKKLAWYASIGVPEYWIVDPEQKTLERLVLQGERYLIAEVVGEEQVFHPESFDGLEVPLAELWTLPGAAAA